MSDEQAPDDPGEDARGTSILGRLGLPVQRRIETGRGISHVLRGGNLRGPDAFEMWGEDVPTLVGAPVGRSLVRPFPVRALLPEGDVEGYLGQRPLGSVPARVVQGVSELANPAWWVRQHTSRDAHAHVLTLGDLAWSVRTTRLRTFSFRRGDDEIATMTRDEIAVAASATPLDHVVVAALALVAPETTITAASGRDASLDAPPADPIALPDSWRALDASSGTTPHQLHRSPRGDVLVGGRRGAGGEDGDAAWVNRVWGERIPTIEVLVPRQGGRPGPPRLRLHAAGGTTTTATLRRSSSGRGGRAGLLDRLAPTPRLDVSVVLAGRTWTVSPGRGDLDRSVTRDGVVLASWWGPALTIAEAADPLDTSVAVALHHARL